MQRTKHRYLPLISAAALFTVLPAQAQWANPFAKAKTGTLYVTIELQGEGRYAGADKVTTESVRVARKLQLEFPMQMAGLMMASWADEQKKPEMKAPSPDDPMVKMGKAIEACGTDENCKMRVAMQIAQAQMSGNAPKMQNPELPDSTRYQNWQHTAACAKGTVTVADQAKGVSMGEAEGSFSYAYTLTGTTNVPQDATVCSAALSIDNKTGQYSVRLDLLRVPVKVKYVGQNWAHKSPEGKTTFVDHPTAAPNSPPVLRILDRKLEANAKNIVLEQNLGNIGTVNFYEGRNDKQRAPVSAKVSIRFEPK